MNSPHTDPALGLSGRIAAHFQSAQITPLLALVALLLGFFALTVTPREEEPQIDVTMAKVLIAFPGAAVKDVESMVSTPAEQVLSQMADVEHVMSMSQPGLSVVTVQFKVGVTRTEALVRLQDTVSSHADWLPMGLGVMPPLIKPTGIDDVPIVSLTLHAKEAQRPPLSLEDLAHSLEVELKRIPGTREVRTIGDHRRAIRIELDAQKMAASGVTVADLRAALAGANAALPSGEQVRDGQVISIETGPFLSSAEEVAQVMVGVRGERPIHLRDVATIVDGHSPLRHFVWHQLPQDSEPRPALTLAITKKSGQNAIEVASAIEARIQDLRGTLIPPDIEVSTTRNYGQTADDKARQLIQKLLFATASVVALVFVSLGRREAAIVGAAVVLTLTATLFASWAWGFTLNRVSLFALIFSIGILVDDAIVVVENIHRHQLLHPQKPLWALIPGAVDEVGSPTILATLTVIAALLPMAFVSGLMGPYMGPIPINASLGMLISLAIAFTVTPWLARRWMKEHSAHSESRLTPWLTQRFNQVFAPLLSPERGRKNRQKMGLGIFALIALALALPMSGAVMLKMLPFDNKSELQVLIDLPAGTPLEHTAATAQAMGQYLATQPEVKDWQTYVGVAAPINFNGLVRQYDMRAGHTVADLQVNLQGKSERKAQSHAIATRMRPALQALAKQWGAQVKIVEVPPGPPVLAPIVAEIYGPDEEGRRSLAQSVRRVFEQQEGVVDVDDSAIAPAPRTLILVDRDKASRLGVSQQAIATTLKAGLDGEEATYIHDASKYPVPALLQLPLSEQGHMDALLSLTVRSSDGRSVPMRELVSLEQAQRQQPIYHKDLQPVHYVVADMAGKIDSPLYGMFAMRSAIAKIQTPNGQPVQEHFIAPPGDSLRHYHLKWDGEWQITYETFRDMGAAYAVGLVLIYLLVVAQFGSYLVPLVIMAPIPLTILGVMPGHALLGAPFTATSMIGMIALAGIIVRNSILLVDFIQGQVAQGVALETAIVQSAIARAQPIVLTGLAAMLGAFFILDDPIFNGLAISLVFGILVSTVLTLVIIPTLYYVISRSKS